MFPKKPPLAAALLLAAALCLPAQTHDAGYSPDVIRGEVWIELEPILGGQVDSEYPLSGDAAAKRALEAAALFFSAMIYGWEFHYDIGEKARQTAEHLELQPLARIPFGDPGLRVTELETRDMRLRLWADYRLSEAQQRKLRSWRAGTIRSAQALGHSPLDPAPAANGAADETPGWLAVRKAALEDAARAALRAMLRGQERNRPKEAAGFISLASFPRYFMDSGRWAADARFHVELREIIPFAAY
jgi:hypothetical protein